MSDPTDGRDGFDDDLWSEPTASPPPRRGRDRGRREPGRGPARPPRRNDGPRPVTARRDRPGRPGTVPVGPSLAAGAVAADDGPDRRHAETADDGYDDDLVELPREGSFPRWLIVLVVVLVGIGSVVGGVLWWYDRQINPPGGPGEAVTVEIPQGSSTAGIATILDREGVISNAMVFNFYASRRGVGRFQAGVYELRQNSSFDQAIDTLGQGPSAPISQTRDVRVTIAEGLTVDQLLDRVADQVPRFERDALQAAVDDGAVVSDLQPDGVDSYEGLFFPATYEVASSTTEVDFLNELAAEMSRRVGDVEAARADILATYGVEVDAYDLLIIASMVQAEAGNVDEAPQIATVIYNRLEEGMPLGIDAVDRYGAQLAGVTVDYEDTDAPYNTRRNAGMPPTPIAAPGDFALQAAFDPADGPWRYYVLTEERSHTFSVTLDEHNAATAICRERNLGCG